MRASADAVALTTTVPLDDDSDLPPIPEPIDPATIPPGPRLTAMDPAHLAEYGFVLLDPVGIPKIDKELATVLGLNQAGTGTVTDVVLARVTNGYGVGSCELCWVVSVNRGRMPKSGPATFQGGAQTSTTTAGPPVQPKVHYFVLIDGTTGAFVTGWG